MSVIIFMFQRKEQINKRLLCSYRGDALFSHFSVFRCPLGVLCFYFESQGTYKDLPFCPHPSIPYLGNGQWSNDKSQNGIICGYLCPCLYSSTELAFGVLT